MTVLKSRTAKNAPTLTFKPFKEKLIVTSFSVEVYTNLYFLVRDITYGNAVDLHGYN